ncbi:MAG: glycoside hydrolase family 3 N-terminal domain-containing protein, partial [Bacteroidota bacterium]
MPRYILTFLILLFIQHLQAQDMPTYPFQDPQLSMEERVEDLISRMTVEEKVGQLMFEAPEISRLGIRNYSWWNECLHGLARNGRATIFPQAIGLASTFDPDLMHRIGEAIADEARAKYNANKARGYMDRYAGLTFWSPNVNLFRDPRWGRGQETYGEDPHLISQMGVSFVKGLQGEGEYMKVAAMAKHFAVHSGPEKLRHEFDAQVSRHDLWNTYLPAFEALVTKADVEGIMGAYNRTNGQPCNAHPYLMQEVLREKWGFDGYFVSDCWAIEDFFRGHGVAATRAEAAAMALNAGCNLNCGNTYPELLASIEQGLTSEEEVDANLRLLLPTLFRLGIFDPAGSTPYDEISTDVVRSDSHLDLAYEAALKSLVLLKNKDNTLPLDPNVQSVFVTGPMAANAQALLANYYGVSDHLTTLLEGIVGNVSDHTAIRYVQGALMDRPNVNPVDWYSEEAQIADVTIACMGISQLMEGEEGEAIASPSYGDREQINLPQHQIEFLKLIRQKAEGKKLVVVLTGGSAISSPELHELADAI